MNKLFIVACLFVVVYAQRAPIYPNTPATTTPVANYQEPFLYDAGCAGDEFFYIQYDFAAQTVSNSLFLPFQIGNT